MNPQPKTKHRRRRGILKKIKLITEIKETKVEENDFQRSILRVQSMLKGYRVGKNQNPPPESNALRQHPA